MSKYKIQYRPKETYKKVYDMEGKYHKIENNNTKTNRNKSDEGLDNLKEDIDTINNLINGLPNSIQSIITTPVSGISYVLDTFDPNTDIGPKSGLVITVPEDIYNNDNNDNNIDPLTDVNPNGEINLFPDLPDINIEVIKESDPEEKIKAQFQKDLKNIFIDFNNKLKNTLSNYYTGLLKTAKECGIENYMELQKPFIADSKNIKNKFISDAIIKSQIIRDQKQRLITKFFDIDEMITAIRRCKVSEELKIRYYKAQYDKEDSFLKVNKNTILADARLEYDKKYKENLYGLYKCLNSTVILLDECLQQSLVESQAKAILIKEEGIKL